MDPREEQRLREVRQDAQRLMKERGSPTAREYADAIEREFAPSRDPEVRREVQRITEWLRSSLRG